jgi:phospholipid transport system substrate-binding protein
LIHRRLQNVQARGRYAGGLFALIIILCVNPAQGRAETQDPQILVATTIEALRSRVVADQARIEREPAWAMGVIADAVEPHMDIRLAGRLVLGRHWRDASEGQRDAFVDGLRRLLLRVFALHISNYTDANVTYTPTIFSGAKGQRAKVGTTVSRNGSPAVPVDFRLHRVEGAWKVYDVAIFGVSIVRTYHATIDADIRARGLDSVIEQINSMIPVSPERATKGRESAPGYNS